MAFWSKELVTALATTHLPLAEVPRAITAAAVSPRRVLARRLAPRPRRGESAAHRGISALNPHAGEGGLLGDEERTRIAPGIERARARLAKEGRDAELRGPIPAETAMRIALARSSTAWSRCTTTRRPSR